MTNNKLKILVDAFGGDYAPDEIIKGTRLAIDELNVSAKLFGDETKIRDSAKKMKISLEDIEIEDARDLISNKDSAIEITRSKKNSSMAKGLIALANSEGDVFVSAGSSGALLAGACLIVKRAKGIKRIAFAPAIPKKKGVFLLIDSGANSSCTPEMLGQFGIMGSNYMKNVLKIDNPRVGLLNIGTEENKGDNLRLKAFKILSENNVNFVGNIEAREVPEDAADVVVTDGFTGNIFLKTYEGMVKILMSKFKEIFLTNFKTKLGAFLIKDELMRIKQNMDYSEYGGAPLLGASKPIFKAHGNSNAKCIKNAIRLAKELKKIDSL
ncbi:MAG: phosphate acyltransferase PlsX [Oscillospiraceae bacterium]|jgi:glycerol-3-phosphate acyltransferase PlsX|nr:phosphate acyltransferase PlsX [Oscillospiraceae bacterium]